MDQASPNPPEFHPEIRQIERELVKFFTEKAVEFIGRHPIVATVMTYFYTRRNLTQRHIQRLTGYSAGAISKSVRQLVAMNLITKETVPGSHTHIYRMEGLPFTSAPYFFRTASLLEDTEQELQELQEILNENREEMQNLDGYREISATVTYFLKLLPQISVFAAKIEDELKNLTSDRP